MGVNAAQHLMNEASFHSTFPILIIAKILLLILIGALSFLYSNRMSIYVCVCVCVGVCICMFPIFFKMAMSIELEFSGIFCIITTI